MGSLCVLSEPLLVLTDEWLGRLLPLRHPRHMSRRPAAVSAARGAGSAWLEYLRGLALGPGRIIITSGTY